MGFSRLRTKKAIMAMGGLWLAIAMGLSPAGARGIALKAPKPREEVSQKVTVLVVSTLEGLALHFDWGKEKPALALIKGASTQGVGKWWVVFDGKATLSLPNLKENPVPGFTGIDVIGVKEGVVLQVGIASHRTPVVVQEGPQWRILFKSQPLTVQENAPIYLPQTKKDGLAVGLKNCGKEVRFKDPDTGYTYVVFPSHQLGFGVAEGHSFPEFHISSSAQGVGFQILKDGIAVNATSNQAMVIHPEGLAITLPRERNRIRAQTIPAGFFEGADGLPWKRRQRKINEELLDLPHDRHGPGELEIAWLLLGQGQAVEALGYLAHLAQMRPSIADLPLFKALQGLGSLVLSRLPESQQYLSALPEDPEIQFWLSLGYALHHVTMAPQPLTRVRVPLQIAKTILQSYPRPLRNQLGAFTLRACIAIDDLETLALFLDEGTRPETGTEREVFDLAKAMVLMGHHKPDEALQIFGRLMEKAVSPEVRDIALFNYVVYRLETNVMKEKDALPQLERLASQWQEGWLGHRVAAYLAGRKLDRSIHH